MTNEDILFILRDEHESILEKVFYYEEMAKKSFLPYKRKMYKKLSEQLYETDRIIVRIICYMKNRRAES